jgi:putative OPT family oligopeptide transporter
VSEPASSTPAPLVPYVAAETRMAELSLRAVLLGAGMSLAFGMVNAYLGLRVGLTVSASIPSAVLSMAILRGVLRRGTILENNVVHTIASSGESLAAGVIFTLPALVFLGSPPTTTEIFAIAVAAGFLGILAMVPLRRSLTIERHEELPFPEGTACALVLVAGDRGGTSATPVIWGIGAGAAYAFLAKGLGLWRDTVFWSADRLHKASIGFELTPIFLGVGYLIGPRIAGVMLAGGLIGWVLLLPLFDAFGASGFLAFGADPTGLAPKEIWSRAVRFVGAGAVAAGGIVALVRAVPVMQRSLARLWSSLAPRETSTSRLERDLPGAVVLGGFAAIGLALWILPIYDLPFLGAALAVFFAFFFVVVSAEMVGLIGTTSQPVSGMTITALLVTAFVVLSAGYGGAGGSTIAIRAAAVVCIAIALSGDMSQDLKTGALLGATPRSLQIGEMVGVAVAALRAGWVLFLLHQAYGLGSELLPAPQAKLMATLVSGVMDGNLPWKLLGLGAAIALAAEAVGVRSLPFAIGLYLPISTTAPLIFGGLIRGWHDRRRAGASTEPHEAAPATLLASGLVAGDALMGIGIAALVAGGVAETIALRTPGPGALEDAIAIAPFVLLVLGFLGLSARFGARNGAG